MGLLRLILACAVVIAHSAPIPGLPLLGGGLAVKVFFIVSGFYMALILSEKYQHRPNGRWLFYSNRFLRIYPLYWLVLATDLALGALMPAWSTNAGASALHAEVLHVSGLGAFLALVFTELALMGGEVFSLLGWVPGQGWVAWTQDAPVEAVRGWRAVLLPHAWTLSCEVAFYLLAPWLNRWRSAWLAGLGAACLALTVLLPRLIDPRLAEVAVDFWMPLQLGFFAAGMLAWRLGRALPSAFRGTLGALLGAGLLGVVLGFDRLAQLSSTGSLLLLLAAAILGIPALFARTQTSGWDRRLGDLSYPVYLCHLIPVHVLATQGPAVFGVPHFTQTAAYPLLAILLSCLLAWLLNRAVEKPLDRWRQARLRTAASPD